MSKQLIVILSAAAALFLLFFFGRTAAKKEKVATTPAAAVTTAGGFNIDRNTDSLKKTLSPAAAEMLAKMENEVKRGDVKEQKIKSYTAIAGFWKDSLQAFEPYAYNLAEAAKLDNSEKSLNFAGQLFLNRLRTEHDPVKKDWAQASAIELFEKALEINPKSVEGRIGLGSTYIFGNGSSGNPALTMQGIQQLLSVVREDSTNMQAQMMLGIGGAVSGQYDKAIERLSKVVAAEPNNVEAISFLADSYAAAGNRTEAIKWYSLTKRLINDPHYSEEVNKRIKELQ